MTDSRKGTQDGGATLRILVALGWVFVIAMVPHRHWRWQLVSALCAIGLTPACGLKVRTLGARLLAAAPFIALVAVGQWGQPEWHFRIGSLFLKGLLSLWVMCLLMACTPFPTFLVGLRTLGVPWLIVELLGFWERYVHVLREEWERMRLAREARTFGRVRGMEFAALARSLGLLLVRSFERAERVHQAMLARGYRIRGASRA